MFREIASESLRSRRPQSFAAGTEAIPLVCAGGQRWRGSIPRYGTPARAECPLAISHSTIAYFRWGDHRLLVEQFTRIPGELQLGLQLNDPSMLRGQFVGLNAQHAFADSRID